MAKKKSKSKSSSKTTSIDDEERQYIMENLVDVKDRISTMERLYDEGKMTLLELGKSEQKPLASSTTDNDTFNNEGPKKEEEVNLEESTFSFLIAIRPWTGPFFTALGIVVLKNTMFAMIIYDLFASSGGDGLEIPALVPISVFIAQIMSCALAVLTSNDLISALMMAYHGYDMTMQDAFEEGAGQFWQWAMSMGLTFFDGAIGLFAAFILVITSTTVLDVFLNFAAVAFVAELDDMFFLLADRNLMGKYNKEATDVVKENAFLRHAYIVKPQIIHRGLLYTLMFFIMAGSLTVYIAQINGRFTSQTLFFQFGDDIRADLGLHSGFYTLNTDLGSVARNGFVYEEERDGGASVGYCAEKAKWTVSLGSKDNPCKGIIAESTTTRSFDVISTAEDTWFAEFPDSDILRFLPLGDFLLIKGCESSEDCGGEGQGSCNDKSRCECEIGFSGAQCQINDEEICPSIKLNELYGSDWPLLERTVSNSFERVEGGSCYSHPVFLNNATQDVVFYSGLRWVVSRLMEINPAGGEAAIDTLMDPSFHALSVGQVDFLSEKVLFRSSDEGDGTPVGLSWVSGGGALKEIDEKSPLSSPVRFLCTLCNDDSNKCLYEGTCLDGICDCQRSTKGTLCSITPVSDGFCDPFFNKEEFLYDGGDCCQATCDNSATTECGVAETALESFLFGFDSCSDPQVTASCLGGGEACFLEDETFGVTVLSRPVLWMAGNGNTVATSGILDKQLRIIERSPLGWKQRGQTLQLDDDDSIEQVGFASPPASFRERRGDGNIPMAVFISPDFGRKARIFYSNTFDEEWIETPPLQFDFLGFEVESMRGLAYFLPYKHAEGDTQERLIALTVSSLFADAGLDFPVNIYSAPLNNGVAGDWTLASSGSGHGSANNVALSGNGLLWITFNSLTSTLSVMDTFNASNSYEVFYDFPGDIQNIELDYLGEMMTVVTQNANTNVTNILRFEVSSELNLVGESGDLEIDDFDGSSASDVFVVSSEGRSVALITADCTGTTACRAESDFGADVKAYIYTQNRTLGFDFIGLFELSGVRITEFPIAFPDLALSDDGKTIAFADGSVNRFEDAKLYDLGDRCGIDEAKVRVVFQYKDTRWTSPWSLVKEQYFPLADMLVMNPSETPLYRTKGLVESEAVRHTTTSEEICIPQSVVNCARFSVYPFDTVGDTSASAQFATISQESAVFVKANDTEFQTFEPKFALALPGASFTLGDGNCSIYESLQCPGGKLLFSIILPTYRRIVTTGELFFGDVTTRPNWSLSSDSGGQLVVAFKNYVPGEIPPGPAILEERCLDPGCYTLRFSGEYGFVAGSGNYTAWLNGAEVFSSNVPNSTISHTFGTC